MAEIKIRTEEILLQCRYAEVISLSGHTYNQQRRGKGGVIVWIKTPSLSLGVIMFNEIMYGEFSFPVLNLRPNCRNGPQKEEPARTKFFVF